MSQTLFLHIGLPKSGSTFLQKRIFPHLSHLAVRSMPPNEHFTERGTRLLESVFARSDTIWARDADRVLDALLGSGWQSDDRDILVSDEAIGRSTSRQALCAGHLAGMKSALRKRGVERFKLLFFVRRQDEWLASHYVQISDRLEKAGQRDFERLVARIADPLGDRFKFGALLDYSATRSAIASVVGKDNVKVLPMEWLRVDLPELERELADWLNLGGEGLNLGGQKVENRRNAGEGAWTLRDRSLIGKASRVLLRRESVIRLDAALSRQILDVYSRSNRELEEETNLDLRNLGYFPDAGLGENRAKARQRGGKKCASVAAACALL